MVTNQFTSSKPMPGRGFVLPSVSRCLEPLIMETLALVFDILLEELHISDENILPKWLIRQLKIFDL